MMPPLITEPFVMVTKKIFNKKQKIFDENDRIDKSRRLPHRSISGLILTIRHDGGTGYKAQEKK
jgi:hypothetical protein